MIKWSVQILIVVAIVFGVVGCSVEARLNKEDENKRMKCTDTRDGEVFYFNTNDITNSRFVFPSGASFDVIDEDGKKRHLSSESEAWLKCEQASQ